MNTPFIPLPSLRTAEICKSVDRSGQVLPPTTRRYLAHQVIGVMVWRKKSRIQQELSSGPRCMNQAGIGRYLYSFILAVLRIMVLILDGGDETGNMPEIAAACWDIHIYARN